MFLPDYNNISKRLIKAVIPDYGLHTDSIFLTRRGEEIKKVFSLLGSWPSQPESPLYKQQDIPEAWRDVIAERQRQINIGRTTGRGRVNTGNHPARVVTWKKRPR